jgi:hypothetical protein
MIITLKIALIRALYYKNECLQKKPPPRRRVGPEAYYDGISKQLSAYARWRVAANLTRRA